MSDRPDRLETTEQIEWMPMLEGGRKVVRPRPPVDKK